MSSRRFNNRPSMPPSTIITWPVTCPDTVAEDAIAICHATSMGCATFLRGVLYYEAKLIEDHTQCVTDVRSKGLINCIWIFHSVSCHWCVNPAWRYAVNTAFRRNLHDLVLSDRVRPYMIATLSISVLVENLLK